MRRDRQMAEVDDLDLKMDGGTIVYRAKMKVSFKYEE
jgi:flavin-binding protein dodecin